jgi:ADP-heptose:LPS heptosyltransferase
LAALREESGVEVLSHAGIDNREDLEGLAGLIEGCDLVVSVGNATAHLSGALGQRTWVLLPYVAGWRWLHEGSRCPWYESVRLYRQSERGSWTDVLDRISKSFFLEHD